MASPCASGPIAHKARTFSSRLHFVSPWRCSLRFSPFAPWCAPRRAFLKTVCDQLKQKGTGPGARSSHAISLVGSKLYAFGGEFEPHVPVDNHLYVFDLHSRTWSIQEASGDAPPPRVGVGVAAVGPIIYVFGGRDATHRELNELYCFNTSTNQWKLLSSGETGSQNRSYHSITADSQNVFVFGGCGVEGRLNDLWAYNVVDQKWNKFPSPGEACKGRGGPGLEVVEGKIWVVYGFTGEEADDVYCFDIAKGEWKEVETKGKKPSARSVFSTVVVGKQIMIFGGEVDPSDLGHMRAGCFTGEAYGLDTKTFEWRKWEDRVGSEEHLGPRGWCAFAAGSRDGEEGLLVYGGNSPSNDRLDDIFFFTPNSTQVIGN